MSPWTHLVGWTLIHFVWQGAALALAAAGALRLWRHRSANARYAIACGALAAMLAAPVLTARVLLASGAAPAADVGQQQANAVTGPLSPAPRTWRDDGGMAVSAMRAAGVDDPLPAVVFVWITGVALLTVRLAGGVWRVRRLQVVSLAADASLWQAAADRMASRLGLRSTIHVVESSLVDAPAALGWLRPVILLPLAGFASLTPAQVEAILAHELIHIRRHDFLVNLAQTVAETLLFFHPGVWWVSARIREEREYCCDDVAVAVCGDVVDYAAALAELEACRSRGTALALAATGGSLVGRVRRILQLPVADEDRSLGWIGTLGLALLVAGGMSGIQLSSVGSDDGGVLLADSAQEPIVAPNTFDWQVQRTEHFEIHYYAALTPVLERVADAAERAYQRVSSELRYDLPFTVPLILFKTRSEFERQQIIPGLSELIARGDVTSFSEPRRNRVAILVEEEPERLFQQITHELTHVFAFDIIPRSTDNARRVEPWIDEGFAEYMTGAWDETHLRQLGDLVATGRVPKMTALTGTGDDLPPRAAVNLGHVAFEFIEAEHGKAGVWQFLLEVRRSVVDGAGEPYQVAFNRTPEEFNAAFAEYLRVRFRQ